MKLTVLYPEYFPTLYTCARLMASDIVIFADSFLFRKNANRCCIKTINGKTCLTIPIHSNNQQSLSEIKIDFQKNWQQNHLRTLEYNYQNAAYYYLVEHKIEKIFLSQHDNLADLLLATTLFFIDLLQIDKKVIKSSTLPLVKNREQRVIEWVGALNCQTYLIDAKDIKYIDCNVIQNKDVKIEIIEPQIKPYHQQFNEFIENCSIIDLLYNEGWESKFLLNYNIKKLG